MSKAKKATCMKCESGSIRQKVPGGPYYYRYQINGSRKEVSLRTANKEEALKKVKALTSVTQAQSVEVIAAHVSQARGLSKKKMELPLNEIWDIYSKHPDRAMPHTIAEQIKYEGDLDDFVKFASKSYSKSKYAHPIALTVNDVSLEIAEAFSLYVKDTQQLSVHTHNRKIKHLRKIFSVLSDYYSHTNPFSSKTLFRSDREEQCSKVNRQAFTRDQLRDLIKELENPERKLINKNEIRVIFFIGIYTGQRLKDCVLLQWQNIDFERERICFVQFKTGKRVSLPIAPELFAVLKEALQWKANQYVCPKTAARYQGENSTGKNTGNGLVNIDVLRVIRWIGLEPSIAVEGRKKKATVYGFHSLRHSFVFICANANVANSSLLSFIGTDSEIAEKYYTHVGDDSQKQALSAISDAMKSMLTPKERIKNALELLKISTPTQDVFEKLRAILED